MNHQGAEIVHIEDDGPEEECWIGDDQPQSKIDDAMITIEARPVDQNEAV